MGGGAEQALEDPGKITKRSALMIFFKKKTFQGISLYCLVDSCISPSPCSVDRVEQDLVSGQ